MNNNCSPLAEPFAKTVRRKLNISGGSRRASKAVELAVERSSGKRRDIYRGLPWQRLGVCCSIGRCPLHVAATCSQ
ncbi:unnamed protein product, partial [Closterium sp. Yama58-4]